MNDNLHQRLAQYSALDCTVARRFSDRPTVLDAAAQIIDEQWRERGLDRSIDPLALYLASQYNNAASPWVRPLQQVLVERYCRRRTLNLNQADDYLSTHLDASPAWRVDVDLHQVELLINEAAPVLIDVYKQLLVDYWTRFDSSGQTPWSWYAGYLQQQLHHIVQRSHRQSDLAAFALATANLVQGYPRPEQREAWNKGGLTVSHLALDFSADGYLDADLASAMLIEHSDPTPTRNLTLLYTLGGRLAGYDSRQSLLQRIAGSWPAAAIASPRQVQITPATGQVFETQALGLLQQQLQVVDRLTGHYHSKLDAIDLNLDLDRLSSLIDLCGSNETARRQPLVEQLPDWLRLASSKPLMRYSNLLVDVAQAYQNSGGQFWLDGIDNAETFANRRISERFAADHPLDELSPEHVRVINRQTIAAAGGQGEVIVSGSRTTVEYSLAQLAIGNLGLLKPGTVELRSSTPDPLPGWMDESYLRQLVSELDIGSQYPAMLRGKLLDDNEHRQKREQLLTSQLSSQLPALAMELFLQGKVPDQALSHRVAEVFRTASEYAEAHWVLRPLGFIKRPGAAVDHPRNTWLLEPQVPAGGPCLLYRPLHEDSLLYYPDRQALFVAISAPGALQDDLLQRLPAQVRGYYEHGGFLEPHLGAFLPDGALLPLDTPAPIALTVEPSAEQPGSALYLACVSESIARFEEHATSTSQTRWNSWKELGWLLFNTLLPLAGSTLGKVAWLAQIEIALADYVSSDSERDSQRHQLAMVNLLVNIAMLLFSHSIFRLRLEHAKEQSPLTDIPPVPPALPAAVPAAVVASSHPVVQLDFSWSRPDSTLAAPQRIALEALQASVPTAELKAPIANGRLQGLYLHDTDVYCTLDEKAYQVLIDDLLDQPRIVGPDGEPGPLLRRDEAMRWRLDLRLRLKGGMPLNRRINALRQQNLEQSMALADRVSEANRLYQGQIDAMTSAADRLDLSEDNAELNTNLARMQALAAYWESYRQDYEQLNARGAMNHYKTVRAELLQNACLARQSIHLGIKKLYTPLRRQLLALFWRQHQGERLDTNNARIASQRLDTLDNLTDLLITNQQSLEQQQQLLQRLLSRNRPDIDSQHGIATVVTVSATQVGRIRYMRLEALRLRLRLLTPLQGNMLYWLERAWDNLLLAVTQRERVLALSNASEELMVRLLRSIEQQFRAMQRCLAKLAEQPLAASQRQSLVKIDEDVRFFVDDLSARLAELPAYAPSQTVAQLRQQQPGLIDLDEHGLLLGEPRQDNAEIIDIVGIDNDVPTRSYRQGQDGWEQLPAPAQAHTSASVSRKALKRLLKESAPLLASVNKEVLSIEAQSAGSYTSGEIQDLFDLQHRRLREHITAIEQRLTDDNQSDEASQGLDAAQTIGRLNERITQLQDKAVQLRKRAALAQLPSVANIEYLLGLGEIRIAAEGSRTRLAKVKGRPADFLDEYSISHAGKVLWYAHFHYPALDSAKANFVSGHLKTAAQRLQKGGDIYYCPVTLATARRYFFEA